jgi:hypothetical protein
MSLPSIPPDQLPQVIVIQQPQAYQPSSYRGPPKSFWGGWGVLGWMLNISIGLGLAGVLYVAYCVNSGLSAISGAIDDHDNLHAARLKSARAFAKKRLAAFGVVDLAKEANLSLYGNDVELSGMAQHRTGAIYPYSIRWRVATFGDQVRWDVQELILDGEPREH